MEVALTPDEKHLIRGLMIFKVPMEQITGIMLMLESQTQQREMMQWMAEHKTATVPMLIEKAEEISSNRFE